MLVVRWYERQDRSPDIVTRWLAAAAEHLPEAIPRRFGDTEPLRGRFDRDGEAGFARAYADASPLLFLAGTPPVYHASFTAGAPRRRDSTAVHALEVELGADDERVRRFALALTHPDTTYVSASIAGDMILDRRTLYGPAVRPEEPYLAPRGDWLGLPPTPPAWCWFCPAYARLVRRQINAEPVAGGLLYTGGPWVGEAVRARLSEVDPGRRPALRMPAAPHRSALLRLLRGFGR